MNTSLFGTSVPPLLLAALGFVVSATDTIAQNVVLSEFMARNYASIRDEDGDRSDWIELHNRDASAVSLGGWYLTDDSTTPRKWTIPAVTVPPHGFLVIFASGKGRSTVGRELHANFDLNGAGEYLALVRPDGTTVATEFAPAFPAQHRDVSYGLAATRTELVRSGAACQALVPADGSLGTSWTRNGNFTGWQTGVTGVGYDRGITYGAEIRLNVFNTMFGNNETLYLRVPFTAQSPQQFDGLTFRLKYNDGFVGWINGSEVTRDNAPATVQWDSRSVGRRAYSLGKVFSDFDAGHVLGTIGSTNTLAVQLLNNWHSDVATVVLPELIAGRYDGTRKFFDTPSPGVVDDSGVLGVVGLTQIGGQRGLASGPVDAWMVCASPQATIRYTTNGDEPTATTGNVYTGPVTVNRSTALRARAFRTGYAPSNIATKTFIFPADVFTQPVSPSGFPTTWGGPGSAGPSIAADYEMDPRIVNDSAYQSELDEALRQLPIVALTADSSDLFAPRTGIYISPQYDPSEPREAPFSVEYIEVDGADDFQIDAGMRVTGFGSTWQWGSKKLSLRMLFKAKYGARKLDYRMFDDTSVTEFDTLTLDAYFAFSWNYNHFLSNAGERADRFRRAQYMRDHYASLLQARMGGVATHGKYVHVFINGLYWGVYNIHERPDANFQVSYQGGEPDEWDVMRHTSGNAQDGNNREWLRVLSLANGASSSSGYAAVKQVLDVQDLADYMIMNLFVGFGQDWPQKNWYASRNRVRPGALWRMHSWDAEHTLKDVNTNQTGVDFAGSPARLYSKLRGNPEWRLLFADRVHEHFFNDGVLYVDPQRPAWDPQHPERNRPAALYAQIADELYKPIVLESARWGNAFSTIAHSRNQHWAVERDRLLNTYFPRRASIVLGQFRGRGLYPSLAAPVFSQHGGPITVPYTLTMTGPGSSTIYYTVDGTDPRLAGGQVSGGAIAYSGGVTLRGTTTVRARTRDSGGNWSALNDATFVAQDIVINEFVASNTSGATDEAGEFEDWIELLNQSNVAVDLGGFYLTDDPMWPTRWRIPDGTIIGAGQVLLVWADDEPGDGPLHASFRLASGGESIVLVQPDGQSVMDRITFGVQAADIATARLYDGFGPWVTVGNATPQALNDPGSCGIRRYSGRDYGAHTIRFDVTGTPQLGATVTLRWQGPPNGVHHLLADGLPGYVEVPGTGQALLLGTTLAYVNSLVADGNGDLAVPVQVPNDAGLVGARMYLQSLLLRPGPTFDLSTAVELTFCR